ncbi:hypothetical protein AB0F52_01570 [Amycolatopsis sp. NPDC024027]|uniref:hypothetical protein n=1 Tax=Amycolatopsis sp. NPDC024027 TaxID=3154327 RepID=UPI0033C315E6
MELDSLMGTTRPKNRRWIEAAADDLDFDYLADTTGPAGGLQAEDTGGGVVDPELELSERASGWAA